MISAGQHVVIFGMTGCGKTTLTREIASTYQRRIIFDRLLEWTDGNYPITRDFNEFAHLYRATFSDESFTIIFRPRPGLDGDSLLEITNNILALINQVESHEKRGIALVFEEVWLYAPLHSIPPWLQEIALTGRHYNISIIANSQRPAHVSKTLVTQARHVFVGQFFEKNERKYFEETLGNIPELQTSPKPGTFIWFRPAYPESTTTVSVF